jgi:hypothetical protein
MREEVGVGVRGGLDRVLGVQEVRHGEVGPGQLVHDIGAGSAEALRVIGEAAGEPGGGLQPELAMS